MASNNEDRGALFSREKKTAKSPDMGGDVTLSRKTVQYLVECIQSGKPAKLSISGWRQTAKTGVGYLSCVYQPPFQDDQFTKQARPQDRQRTPSRQEFQKPDPIDESPPWEF